MKTFSLLILLSLSFIHLNANYNIGLYSNRESNITQFAISEIQLPLNTFT